MSKQVMGLQARITNKYRTGYQDLDEWEYLGPVKRTRLVDVSDPDDEDYETHRCLVVIPVGIHGQGEGVSQCLAH